MDENYCCNRRQFRVRGAQNQRRLLRNQSNFVLKSIMAEERNGRVARYRRESRGMLLAAGVSSSANDLLPNSLMIF